MRKLPAHLRVAASVLALIVLSVILAGWIAPYPPAGQDLASRLAAPSGAHWLGTDHLGRDTLSRLLDGGRFSLTIAALATVLTAVIGTAIGVLSARRRGWLDEFFTRTNDILLAMPEMVVALFLVAALGSRLSVAAAGPDRDRLDALRPAGQGTRLRHLCARLHRGGPRGGLHALRSSSGGTSCPTSPRRCWDRPRSGSGSS